MKTRVVIALALTAAAVRLIPLQFLHPLNWDELEFFRATSWIAEGRIPFRDFWEHHTPLVWFLFAPFTLLTKSAGVNAIVLLRWAQVPVWIGTFALTNLWMRNAGIERFVRWSAMTIAVASSLFMTPAIEYRVEAVGCLLVMAGLVLAQRGRFFPAGAAFCLAGFANLRLGPMLCVAILALLIAHRQRAATMIAGAFAALLASIAFFAATGSLRPLWQQVWIENLAEKYATPTLGGFVHRLLVPFGVRILATDRLFELAAVDAAGICVLLLGVAGFVLAIRKRGDWLVLAAVQLANVLFIAYMKFIYNYHFALVVILMIPLLAAILQRIPPRAVIAILIVCCAVNLFASLFRGKELDRAYQDLIMREADARTRPGDAVFSGIPWAIRREPAYRFWFLPELARQLVPRGLAPRYAVNDPPAAVVFDHNLLVWLGRIQPELAPYFVRHYIPVWRELWIPAMNDRLRPGSTADWIVPRDGVYRVYTSPALARHPWFREPLAVGSYKGDDASRFTVVLPKPGAGPIRFSGFAGDRVALRKGQRVTALNPSTQEIAVILLSTDDRVLFRAPPPGATLEAESTRVTHMPRLGVRIE
jgi:hypothetical protein